MRHVITVVLTMYLLAGAAFANCGNGNGNGNGCSNTQGPAGPQGPQGDPGAPGANGADGADGSDPKTYNVAVNVGVDVLWKEWNRFFISSGYYFDTVARAHYIDALTLGIRFGKSGEDERVEKLEERLRRLEAALEGKNERTIR